MITATIRWLASASQRSAGGVSLELAVSASLDMLPEDLRYRRRATRAAAVSWGAALLAMVGLAMATYRLFAAYATLEEVITMPAPSMTRVTGAATAPAIPSDMELSRLANSVEQQRKGVLEFEKAAKPRLASYFPWSALLEVILVSTNNEVTLTEMSWASGSITLRGGAPNAKAIIGYTDRLQRSGRFRWVDGATAPELYWIRPDGTQRTELGFVVTAEALPGRSSQ